MTITIKQITMTTNPSGRENWIAKGATVHYSKCLDNQ